MKILHPKGVGVDVTSLQVINDNTLRSGEKVT